MSHVGIIWFSLLASVSIMFTSLPVLFQLPRDAHWFDLECFWKAPVLSLVYLGFIGVSWRSTTFPWLCTTLHYPFFISHVVAQNINSFFFHHFSTPRPRLSSRPHRRGQKLCKNKQTMTNIQQNAKWKKGTIENGSMRTGKKDEQRTHTGWCAEKVNDILRNLRMRRTGPWQQDKTNIHPHYF